MSSVPVGFLPTMMVSPTWMFCRREVSGPSGTLIDRNSRCSSQLGLAMEYARSSGLPSTFRPIMVKWPLEKRSAGSRVVVKLKRRSVQW